MKRRKKIYFDVNANEIVKGLLKKQHASQKAVNEYLSPRMGKLNRAMHMGNELEGLLRLEKLWPDKEWARMVDRARIASIAHEGRINNELRAIFEENLKRFKMYPEESARVERVNKFLQRLKQESNAATAIKDSCPWRKCKRHKTRDGIEPQFSKEDLKRFSNMTPEQIRKDPVYINELRRFQRKNVPLWASLGGLVGGLGGSFTGAAMHGKKGAIAGAAIGGGLGALSVGSSAYQGGKIGSFLASYKHNPKYRKKLEEVMRNGQLNEFYLQEKNAGRYQDDEYDFNDFEEQDVQNEPYSSDLKSALLALGGGAALGFGAGALLHRLRSPKTINELRQKYPELMRKIARIKQMKATQRKMKIRHIAKEVEKAKALAAEPKKKTMQFTVKERPFVLKHKPKKGINPNEYKSNSFVASDVKLNIKPNQKAQYKYI